MPDTAAVAAATKPGAETSEQKLADFASKVAALIAVLGTIEAGLPDSITSNHWVGAVIAVVGVVAKVLVSLGYTQARTAVKVATIQGVATASVPSPSPAPQQ